MARRLGCAVDVDKLCHGAPQLKNRRRVLVHGGRGVSLFVLAQCSGSEGAGADVCCCCEPQIFEKKPLKVKNFGIWMRYNSRTDPINMYKEYRDVTLTGAVAQMYLEVAGRHRGRATGIQIIKTAELSAKECRRDQTVQYHDPKIQFPLPHRVLRPASKALKSSIFKASRPNTFY